MSTKKIKTTNEDIIDINIGGISKKKFRINGDNDKIIELNPSDFNIVNRMSEKYPELEELENKVVNIRGIATDEDSDEVKEMQDFANDLKTIDTAMRDCLNYIFDSDICTACAGNSSMYDVIDGHFRYEIIITALTGLYEENLAKEAKSVQARIKQHTKKYTKK